MASKITVTLDDDTYNTLSREYGNLSRVASYLLEEEAEKVKEAERIKSGGFRPERSWRIHQTARRTIIRKGGEWVLWSAIRPQHGDREVYSQSLWDRLKNDPEIEVREVQRGPQLRRFARYRPLV